jgi:hypothetical protein
VQHSRSGQSGSTSGEDPLAECVARACEREGGVRVQALEAAGARLPADAAGQLRPQAPLLLVPLWTLAPSSGSSARGAEALDTACRLEARDGRDEMRARQPERRRERLAGLVERLLLGDRRPPVGAADGLLA